MSAVSGRFLALVAAALLQFSAANAATLSIIGGASDTLDSQFDPTASGGAAIGDKITAFTGKRGFYDGGLWLDGQAKVTFTYIGYEAGAYNYFHNFTDGVKTFVNKTTPSGTALTVTVTEAGYVPFKFQTSGLSDPADPGMLNNAISGDGSKTGVKSAFAPLGLAFSEISRNGRSVLAFFDDGRAVDSDYDDMIVRIQVAPVPLPAGGVLLASALAGAAALRRRRKA